VAELERAIEAARQGRLAVMAGAGISMLPPSNLPSWWEFTTALLTAAAGNVSRNDRCRQWHQDVVAEQVCRRWMWCRSDARPRPDRRTGALYIARRSVGSVGGLGHQPLDGREVRALVADVSYHPA
jgi:hypothetical protein